MAYQYKGAIEARLKTFEKYLKSKQYAKSTIRQNRNYAGIFLTWLEEENEAPKDIDYKYFTHFIFQLKTKYSAKLTRRIILAVRHYYQSLNLDKNPADGIYIKGNHRNIIHQTVEYKEIIGVYEGFRTLDNREKRNKVMLGLMIYQGLKLSDLQTLEPRDVQLKEGKIYVCGSRKSNARILKLEAHQLLELQKYLKAIRPKMLENLKDNRHGKKAKLIDPIIYDRLFFGENGSLEIKSSLRYLFKSIKAKKPGLTSIKIIRTTVLAEWLKSEDVRIVQYKAGHKYVSTTERYNAGNLKELKEQLDKYHPLK